LLLEVDTFEDSFTDEQTSLLQRGLGLGIGRFGSDADYSKLNS